MELLGKPYKIIYEAKNFKTGLTGIFATVIKPDGNTIGPIPLTEIAETGFEGIYSGTLSLSTSDLEGMYTGVIISPNENNYSRAFKVSFIDPSSLGGGVGSGSGSDGAQLVGVIKVINLKSSVKINKLKGNIKTAKLNGVLPLNKKLQGKIATNKLTGVLKCRN